MKTPVPNAAPVDARDADDASGGSEQPRTLSRYPAGPGSRRRALLLVGLSLALFLGLLPFADHYLGVAPWFIPLYQPVVVINDLITAALLFGHLRLQRQSAILMLACGYLYSAVMAIIHLLSFPGALAPAGLLGGGPQSTAYLHVFWHAGFPLAVIGYALSKERDRRFADDGVQTRAILATLAGAALLSAVAILGHDLLPPMLAGARYSGWFNLGRFGQWILTGVALAVMFRRRSPSALDLWLMVVLAAWFFEIGLVSIFNAGRWDVGFYAGRLYALFASSIVLVMLLMEQVQMYLDLARAEHSARGAALLRERQETLRLADRRKDEFLATLAHELRNPLAPIRNAVSLLARLPHLPPQAEKMVGVVDRQSRHLARLVDDLLEVSRITQGKVSLQKKSVSLADCLADALHAVDGALKAAGHEVALQLSEDPLQADADATRIAQCFLNLLNNAIKFTPRGGLIRIESLRAGGQAQVSISDSGIGIAPENLEQIFGLFSQLTPALERSQGGLGIGLSLVKGLVELHGGTVTASSPGPGQGSTFTVRLPLVAQPAGPAEEPRISQEARRHPRRVLVVDDNVDAASSLVALLQSSGHQVREAHDGAAALALAGEFQPDVVLLDIGMPGMNGLEVARALRSRPHRHDPRIIAVTGWGQERDRRLTREAGFDFHLTKPVNHIELDVLLA